MSVTLNSDGEISLQQAAEFRLLERLRGFGFAEVGGTVCHVVREPKGRNS